MSDYTGDRFRPLNRGSTSWKWEEYLQLTFGLSFFCWEILVLRNTFSGHQTLILLSSNYIYTFLGMLLLAHISSCFSCVENRSEIPFHEYAFGQKRCAPLVTRAWCVCWTSWSTTHDIESTIYGTATTCCRYRFFALRQGHWKGFSARARVEIDW